MPELQPHPLSPRPAGLTVSARAAHTQGGRLELGYRLRGDLDALKFPAAATPARRDGLWQHLCFECFVARGDEGAYLELNFSPSSEWAAYRFRGYREGMEPVPDAQICVQVDARRTPGELALDASVALPAPPGASEPAPALLRLSLCAVIEAADGTLGYWSIVHPDPARPDFHRPESLVHAIRN